jgi:hypothetical protein
MTDLTECKFPCESTRKSLTFKFENKTIDICKLNNET